MSTLQGCHLPATTRELLDLYQYLPRFDDVTPALHSLRAAFRLFAFSNGKRSEIDAVLSTLSPNESRHS
jgi:hypothetical protein